MRFGVLLDPHRPAAPCWPSRAHSHRLVTQLNCEIVLSRVISVARSWPRDEVVEKYDAIERAEQTLIRLAAYGTEIARKGVQD